MRAVVLTLWKLGLAGVVAWAGQQSHLRWGEMYAGPGMNQWDALLVVVFFAIVLAGLFLATAGLSAWLLRKRTLPVQMVVDFGLFAAALAIAVWVGVSTRVVDA
jgi:uncharacterized membrane protein